MFLKLEMRGSVLRVLDFLVQIPDILTTAGLFVFGCPDFNSIKNLVTCFPATSWVSHRY